MASSGNATSSTMIKQEPGLMPSIKQEPGTIKTERLSSFRLPRDLTLGGLNAAKASRSQVNKKVYTPNLNAVRNRNSDVKTSRDTTHLGRGRGRGERGKSDRGGRGRGAGRGSSLVQSSGLFSEGTGETHMRRSSAYSRTSDGGDSAAALRRPTIVKREIKIDPEVERKQILEILGDDFDAEPIDSGNMLGDRFTPVTLSEIKTEIKVENPEVKVENKLPTCEYPSSLAEFFSRNHPQMFLLQLPDSLPGQGPDVEPAESAEAEQKLATPDPAESYCTMRNLEEGLLGKIVRYKSGITKLVIGEARFDVDLGMDPGLLQEAMSLNTNQTERSGNLINLGQIQAKLSATPDWEYMFARSASL